MLRLERVENPNSPLSDEEIAWHAECEEREAKILACSGHLWVIDVFEDEEDGVAQLRCELCPAGDMEADVDMIYAVAIGRVSDDPEIWIEDLDKHRGESFFIDIEHRGWQSYEGEWDGETEVSPRKTVKM